MDRIKVRAERRSEPNLQKLARALISIARRQLQAEREAAAERKPGDAA